MRSHEEFIRIAYVGVSPSHRLLPPRCVSTSVVSGKSSQKNLEDLQNSISKDMKNMNKVVGLLQASLPSLCKNTLKLFELAHLQDE